MIKLTVTKGVDPLEALDKALWGDTPSFEGVDSNGCKWKQTAVPAMAIWMVMTLIWLVDERRAAELFAKG